MGGDITVESPPASGAEEKGGRGSVFSFDIQVEPADPAEVVIAKPMRRVVGLLPDQPTYRILVVEDNLQNRVLLSKLMQCVGFKVREADNGQEAIEEFEKWRPHLVWMDMRMPVIDGYTATREIRKIEVGRQETEDREQEELLRVTGYELRVEDELSGEFERATSNQQPVTRTPIIALTAHAFEEEKEKILAAGCDNFVRKPFKEAEIFDVMEKHLDVRYIYDETREQRAEGIEQPSEDILTPEALAELPGVLRAELKQAVVDLDVDLIESIIDRIRDIDRTVGEALENLAKNFEYDKLLALMKL